MQLRDLLPPAWRARVYKALGYVNAVLLVLIAVPQVPFDVPALVVVLGAIANAAGFTLANGNTAPAPPPQEG
jgi:hypothetical protein